MVHSCASGGCHQSAEQSGFQLSRLAIDGVGHPGVTLRNLAQTLEQINWESADESDLLVRARKAHGEQSSSEPLPPHKLKVLQSWVQQLAEAEHQANEPTELPHVVEVDELPITPTLELNAPKLATPAPPSGVRTASYVARDPFDPAVFNDRYATAKQPPVPVVPSPNTATKSSVPHVLAPSDPAPVPVRLPATE